MRLDRLSPPRALAVLAVAVAFVYAWFIAAPLAAVLLIGTGLSLRREGRRGLGALALTAGVAVLAVLLLIALLGAGHGDTGARTFTP